MTVSFLSLQLTEKRRDRIQISGVSGRPAPASFKVSATYQDDYRAQGELTIYGTNAVAKAPRAGRAVLERLHRNGVTFRESLVECLGAGACHSRDPDDRAVADYRETVLRITVADDSRESVERFSAALMPLITAGLSARPATPQVARVSIRSFATGRASSNETESPRRSNCSPVRRGTPPRLEMSRSRPRARKPKAQARPPRLFLK